MMARSLWKLWMERRQGVLGARFRTKLVFAFVSLSFIPPVLLFLIGSGMFTTSIERLFSLRIENSLKDSVSVAQEYYDRLQKEATRFRQADQQSDDRCQAAAPVRETRCSRTIWPGRLKSTAWARLNSSPPPASGRGRCYEPVSVENLYPDTVRPRGQGLCRTGGGGCDGVGEKGRHHAGGRPALRPCAVGRRKTGHCGGRRQFLYSPEPGRKAE